LAREFWCSIARYDGLNAKKLIIRLRSFLKCSSWIWLGFSIFRWLQALCLIDASVYDFAIASAGLRSEIIMLFQDNDFDSIER